jgi:hypothetical protein
LEEKCNLVQDVVCRNITENRYQIPTRNGVFLDTNIYAAGTWVPEQLHISGTGSS